MKWVLIIMTIGLPNLDTKIPFDTMNVCIAAAKVTLERLSTKFPKNEHLAYCVQTDRNVYK